MLRVFRVFAILVICWLGFSDAPFKAQSQGQRPSTNPQLTQTDQQLLDEIERAACLFFWEQADASTGLVKDRSRADGTDKRDEASIAATGFGLTALCIAAERGYLPRQAARKRALTTLRFIWQRLPNEHGFFYHFVDRKNGQRVWKSELSSIDTAILLCGILTCRQYFGDSKIRDLAARIYNRIDWPWMTNGGETLSMGWHPETGFLRSRWDTYAESMMLYLLAMGSHTHPLPPGAWHAWTRPAFEYDGLRYIESGAPLFVHQYSHAWIDFRGVHDAYSDYYQNSISAILAHRSFCLKLKNRFPHFSEDLWGITSSDSAGGYVGWGGPPELGPLDGTIVPAAAGGSIPFLPVETMRVLRTLRTRYASLVWKRYGFIDAFNPLTGWADSDVIGIDLGIMLLMAENARTQFVWNTFALNEEIGRAMKLAGFVENTSDLPASHPRKVN